MARPPGDWDRHQPIQEFDLDGSRQTGWCLDITFDGVDPDEGEDNISFMLEGFSYPYFLKSSPNDVDQIRHTYGDTVAHAKSSPYQSVVGVLARLDDPMETISKKITAGTFLVLGDYRGRPIRTFRVPIKRIIQSFVDFGN